MKLIHIIVVIATFLPLLLINSCNPEQESDVDWIARAEEASNHSNIDSLRDAWCYFNEAYKEDNEIDRSIVRRILETSESQFKHYMDSDSIGALNEAAKYCDLMNEITNKLYPSANEGNTDDFEVISLPDDFPTYNEWEVVAHKKELSAKYISQGISAVDLCEKHADPIECDRVRESFEMAVKYDDSETTRKYKDKYCK